MPLLDAGWGYIYKLTLVQVLAWHQLVSSHDLNQENKTKQQQQNNRPTIPKTEAKEKINTTY